MAEYKILCDTMPETEKVEGIIVFMDPKGNLRKADFKSTFYDFGTIVTNYIFAMDYENTFDQSVELDDIRAYDHMINVYTESDISSTYRSKVDEPYNEKEYIAVSSQYLTICTSISTLYYMDKDFDKTHKITVWPSISAISRVSKVIQEFFLMNITFKIRSKKNFLKRNSFSQFECAYSMHIKNDNTISPRTKCNLIMVDKSKTTRPHTRSYNVSASSISTFIPKKIHNYETEFVMVDENPQFYFPYFSINIKEGDAIDYVTEQAKKGCLSHVYELFYEKKIFMHSNCISLFDPNIFTADTGKMIAEVFISYPEVRGTSVALKYAIDMLFTIGYKII